MNKKKEIYWGDAVITKRKALFGDSAFFYELEAEGCVISDNQEVVSEARKRNLKVVKKTVYIIHTNQHI
jgi:hypothetical protein